VSSNGNTAASRYTEVEVGRIDEIAPGGRKLVHFGDIAIGVFNIDGDFYAIENTCPHQGGPLCEGDLFRHLDAEVTEDKRIRKFFRSEHHDIIACPWHGYEFDIKTGRCLVNPIYSTQPYPTRVEAGAIYVSVPNALAPAST
jgi:nitrite reductase (NADH) small subunit